MTDDASKRNMLLLAGSKAGVKGTPEAEFLEFAKPMIKEHFKDAIASGKPVLFIPYALPLSYKTEEAYTQKVRDTLEPLGIKIIAPKEGEDPRGLLDQAGGIFIGGGNTYRLLKKMQDTRMLGAVRDKINEGLPYLGSSAGSVLACPTIQTTNDMRVCTPQSDEALGVLNFHLNVHFKDDVLFAKEHNGEPTSERLGEFIRENPKKKVLGIREGTALQVKGDAVELVSAPNNPNTKTGILFSYQRNQEEGKPDYSTVELPAGQDISRSLNHERKDIPRA